MIFFNAFWVGGLICGLASILKSFFKLTIGKVTVIFVVFGAILSIYNIYDKIIDYSGSGAILPITSFGNSLAKAAYEGISKQGFIGLFSNLYSTTSLGISFALTCGFIMSFIFNAKD